MIHGKHAGHHRREGCGRADVGSRSFPFDMLFACLQSHTQCGFSQAVNRHTDNAAGHTAFVFVFGGKIGRRRPAETHRNTKTLCTPHGNIGAPRRRLF